MLKKLIEKFNLWRAKKTIEKIVNDKKEVFLTEDEKFFINIILFDFSVNLEEKLEQTENPIERNFLENSLFYVSSLLSVFKVDLSKNWDDKKHKIELNEFDKQILAGAFNNFINIEEQYKKNNEILKQAKEIAEKLGIELD